MENQDQSLFSFHLNENAKTQLKSLAGIVGVAAILSLVVSILKVVSAFVNRDKIQYVKYELLENQTTTATDRSEGMGSAIFGLILGILLFYFLNRFSREVKTGLNANNPQLVHSGFGGLVGYMITIGVILIIIAVALLIVWAGYQSGVK